MSSPDPDTSVAAFSSTPSPSEVQPSSSISTSKEYPKDRRFKLSRACDRCRRRRIKCDEGHPCQPCVTGKVECTFEETAKRIPHKPKKTYILEARMRQLESLIDAIPPSTLAAIQAGIYTEDTAANAGPWSMVHSPRIATEFSQSYSSDYAESVDTTFGHLPQYSEPQYRGHSAQVGHAFGGNGDDASNFNVGPSSKFSVDEQGDTQWHGSSSGLPLLEMLVHAHGYQSFNVDTTTAGLGPSYVTNHRLEEASPQSAGSSGSSISPLSGISQSSLGTGVAMGAWDEDSGPSSMASSDPNDEPFGITYSTITSAIPADLMDELVRQFLSTSYYLYPFLHLTTFVKDYSQPSMWGDTGFTSFIVSICCLSSLHTDNPTLRENSSIVLKWFELFLQLKTLPGAERPTLYGIQGAFIGAVYAFGKGLMSKGLALIAEAATRAIEGGLHRTADAYDWFDPVQDQFGRHPMLRLRDCDVRLPALVTDEHITLDKLDLAGTSTDTLMGAFCCMCQLGIVLEGVLDTPPSRTYTDRPGSFLSRATAIFSGAKHNADLRAEEALLDEAVQVIPPYWQYNYATISSGDLMRISQAERLHCFAYHIRMLIHRRRFSVRAAERVDHGIQGPQTDEERDAIRGIHAAASEIVLAHQAAIARKTLTTYYGIHNVHQLIQVSRSTIAAMLEAREDPLLQDMLTPMIENVRTAFLLSRHWGEHYIDGIRASDMMQEICFLTQIPLAVPAHLSRANTNRKPPVRHIKKRNNARGIVNRRPSPPPAPPTSLPSMFTPAIYSASPTSGLGTTSLTGFDRTTPTNLVTSSLAFSAPLMSPMGEDVLPNISRGFASNNNTPSDSPGGYHHRLASGPPPM